jgi:hypothetical protein
MAATVYGDAFFGVTAETALYTQSVTNDLTVEKAYVKNATGDDVGGSYYNASATGTVSGARNASSLTAAVAGTLSLQNTFDYTSRITGYSSGGRTIIEGISQPRSNTEFQMIEINYEFKPWMA